MTFRNLMQYVTKWQLEHFLEKFLRQIQEGQLTLINEVDEIAAYLQTLPYIVVVGDLSTPGAFAVCHADMPFSDVALQSRLLGNKTLSDYEKDYVTWARPLSYPDQDTYFRETGRTSSSLLAFCGHNIYGVGDVAAVRTSTNMVNLDAGAYRSSVMPMVNITHNEVIVLSNPGATRVPQINGLIAFFFRQKKNN